MCESICNRTVCSNNIVPSSSEVQACLGTTLAQAFFDYAHHDTKKLLHMKGPLKSPNQCFLPDDELPNESPFFPTNDEIIKAKLHENILMIGESILERLEKQIEDNLREDIEKKSQEKFFLYQAKKRVEAQQIADELQFKYENCMKIVQHDMFKQFEAEYADAAKKWTKSTQKAVVQERMNVTRDMIRKMRIEIAHIVESVYTDLEESFRAKRESIIADFNGIMRKKHVKLMQEMHEYQRRVGRDLLIQKRQLEMQNAADIIYVLCLERLRNCKEKHILHKYFEGQMDGFKELIKRLNNVMVVMRNEILNSREENKLLGEQLEEVTKEFQKFINFVFHAVPGQADYLLSYKLQKFMSSDDNKEETIE